MSTTNIPRESVRARYTKGEKCIFIHIILSFAIVLVICIIYCVHLSLVFHTREDLFRTSLRTSKPYKRQGHQEIKYQYIGLVYINATKQEIICNTLLLHERWSLSPGQCAAIRMEPSLSDYLYLWKIKYKIDKQVKHSDIKRSLTHSGFNRGNYENNIGLFEHTEPILTRYYVAPSNIVFDDNLLQNHTNDMFLLDWDEDFLKKGELIDAIPYPVTPITSSICSSYATAVVEAMRNYEFCVKFTKNGLRKTINHGAMLAMNSQIIGFFSWGDIEGKEVPFFILNLLHYRQWFENIVL